MTVKSNSIGKRHQPGLFNCPPGVKAKIREIFSEVDSETVVAVLSRLVLDQIIIMIDKFPVQYQKEIVALLADGYLEKWNKKK